MLPMKKRFFVSMFLCFPLLLSATNVKNNDIILLLYNMI